MTQPPDRELSAGALPFALLLALATPGGADCRLRGVTLSPDPASPTVYEAVTVAVTGTSVDACVPSFIGRTVGEGRIELRAALPEPAQCAQVLTELSFFAPVGLLELGRYELELVVVGDEEGCAYAGDDLSVADGPAPVTGAAATLLYPYFEVDLAEPSGPTTLIAVGNSSREPTVAHATVWTDWGYPSYAFDIFLAAGGVQSLNLRHLFAGTLPATGGDGGEALGCSDPVAVPPLTADTAEELRLLHTGRPSAATGLCAGSGRRGPDVATGFVTVDALERCSDGDLVTPRDPEYFGSPILDPPLGPPLASDRNVLWGDLLFADVDGDNVQSLEAVALPADRERWAVGAPTFYRSLGVYNGADQRAPLAAVWTSRFLRGGAFSPTSHALLWLESSPLLEPIDCDRRDAFVGPCQLVDVEMRDEAGTLTDLVTLANPPEVTALYPVGGQELPTALPFGTLRIDNLVLDACVILPTGETPPRQAYLAVLTEAEGRLSFAFRGSPRR